MPPGLKPVPSPAASRDASGWSSLLVLPSSGLTRGRLR